ncbi:MAG: hypothetical protein A2086_07165 [Spirochaetes bacterium GWD1_27_9]|nr:MAG: hypothetical protein A2Y34_09220 [Spirochaetes bacterium GWC1_27_15]OHD29137.1 MAG: hypothetical protein A2086_07165 [Spirochaetes bacterium GWD1_27_9]
MKKIFLILISSFILFACSDNSSDGKIDTPKKVLIKIYNLSKAKNYDELKKHIYNLTYKSQSNFFNSEDKIIEGIKNYIPYGSFSYSDLAILAHSQIINDYAIPLNQFLFEKYKGILTIDESLAKLAKEKPKNILVYMNSDTTLMFVKINDELKLLYTSYLTTVSQYDPKNQQIDYTEEEKKKLNEKN